MNQIICENKVSEMKALESLSTEEYYQTLSTYCRIIDEKNESSDKLTSGKVDSNNKRTSLRK